MTNLSNLYGAGTVSNTPFGDNWNAEEKFAPSKNAVYDKVELINTNLVTLNARSNKNAIINGDFNIWQRGTSFAAIAHASYSADRVKQLQYSDAVVTVTRDTDVPTQAESGHKSNYSYKLDVTTADVVLASDLIISIRRMIEGYNFAPFMGNTATLSFWVKAVKAGIYCIGIKNSGSDRSYVAEYTINSASTWEKKTITLTFSDSGGTWDYTNGMGLIIEWIIGTGTDYNIASADTWLSVNKSSTSNQVNGVDNVANNFWLAQIQLELGSVATDFEYRDYGTELAMCQRYYERYAMAIVYTNYTMGFCNSTTQALFPFVFFVKKRATPTVTFSAVDDFNIYIKANGLVETTSVAGFEISEYRCGINAGAAAGLTAGEGCMLIAKNSVTTWIAISAEL